MRWACLGLVMCGPVSNGWVYGIKSKTIQMTFVHFARKQITKSEVSAVCSHTVTVSLRGDLKKNKQMLIYILL